MKTIKHLSVVFLFLLSNLTSTISFTQGLYTTSSSPPVSSNGNIQPLVGGKHRFSFTFNYYLTNASCASIFREAGYDSQSKVFSGPFQDKRADETVIAEGFYKNGFLDSTLVVRYINGNIWQKGFYKNGKMSGRWEYFFPDGSPMYVLTIQDNRVWIDVVYDVNGQVLVQNGEGKAIIYHYSNLSETNENRISWRGKIRNGLMQGTWKLYRDEEAVDLKQVYSNGRFVKGFELGKMYNTIDLFPIEQELSLINAEMLQQADCDENPTNDSPPQYSLGPLRLKQDLYKELDRYSLVFPRNCIVKVSFAVSEEGKLSDFKAESDTGVEEPLIEVLQKLSPWMPAMVDYKPIAQRHTYSLYFLNKLIRNKGYWKYDHANRNKSKGNVYRTDRFGNTELVW